MSNETDLDWLARNVHEWYSNATHVRSGGRGPMWTYLPEWEPSEWWFTRDQWLARRSELQNKPSWDDFGESAKFMAQDSDGAWMAFESEPAAKYHVWSSMRGWCGYAREGRDRCRGEVLGDWRDTLDRRPQAEADITDPFDPEFRSVTVSNETIPLEQPVVVASIGDAIQGKCPSCGNTGIHACLGRKVTHTDTANEITKWVAKQQAKGTSDWHERGELPPVGVECETLAEPELQWVAAEVVAHRDGFAIVWVTSEKCGAQCDNPKHFRPIRTERDDLVDVLTKAGISSYAHLVADAILAAGYRKESK